MYRMSSESSRLSTLVVPSLRAANNKHRLLNDLEPGRVTVPSRRLIGATVKVSVSFEDVVAEKRTTGDILLDDDNGCVVIQAVAYGRSLPTASVAATKRIHRTAMVEGANQQQ